MRLPMLPLALLLALARPAGAERLWSDTFAQPLRYEMQTAGAWTGGGRFLAGDAAARLMPPLPSSRSLTVRARMTIVRRSGSGYVLAGASIHADAANSWQLVLVEGPDGRRYCEMVERCDGVHQAQSAAGTPTELMVQNTGDLAVWAPGRAYDLELQLSATGIVGQVTEATSGAFWRRTFAFGSRQAVRRGRPALVAQGLAGAFCAFSVEGGPDDDGPVLKLKEGPAGRAAILRDERGVVAAGLARALASAGFGVTVVSWEEMGRARLPRGRADLLALADARSLPAAARDQVVELLNSGGRVLAVGAPAASAILAPAGGRWRRQAEWVEADARTMQRTPVEIAPDAWTRGALRREQPAAIEAERGSGPATWRVTTDLRGWDGFYTPIAGAFGTDRSLLVFEARGDGRTSQLAVECVEDDGSRWITVIDLGPAWRHYVLRPGDFPYWLDSPTKGRGFAGDRLRPQHVARISFGLSASHTPLVKPGRHSYWLRGLSTAGERPGAAVDFGVPDIETLCPSYKLYPVDAPSTLRAAGEQGVIASGFRAAWTRPAYAPVWRERGRGIRRNRAWRWVPLVEMVDRAGRRRGALVSMVIGDTTYPNAEWANVAVANPADALRPELLPAVVAAARAMTRGLFLLDGGAGLFSYAPGEAVELGARAVNTGRAAAALSLRVTVRDGRGRALFRQERRGSAAPGGVLEAGWSWRAPAIAAGGLTVETTLCAGGRVIDRIVHQIDRLRTDPGRPSEFVRAERGGFSLGGRPWLFRGINYWPTWMAGYPTLDQRSLERYDPEIIERDLAWLASAGANAISAVVATEPADPADARGYRDQRDFLDRCLRHGIRVHFTVPAGRPYQGGDGAKVIDYIRRAGIRNHPAIMGWELAWEPIEGAWAGLDFIRADFNRWVTERYGSVEAAVADWRFDPRATATGPLPTPTAEQSSKEGPWAAFATAFARAFSDLIGRRYGEIVRPLRAFDPQHLISFRGGACGIPTGGVFAHIHSVGVARHMDYLCPEGYNLQTGGWANPTPADDIRKGGLVTGWYRFISRDKPVVWMEFGYTVNGFAGKWTAGRVRIRRANLARQKLELAWFYSMMLESGAAGAAPWWLPGGFRLGEYSDFGLVEPDGTERPSAAVFRAGCRLLGQAEPAVRAGTDLDPSTPMVLDPDSRRWDAWETWSAEYLRMLKAGLRPRLRTPGTGTTSADCPLAAVGGSTVNGSNPPVYLNGEFDSLEVQIGEGAWTEARDGAAMAVPAGAAVRCRARIGNTGEAAWRAGGMTGAVALAGRAKYGAEFRLPITAETPFLGVARVAEATLLPAVIAPVTVSFELCAAGRAWFGERRTVTFTPAEPR